MDSRLKYLGFLSGICGWAVVLLSIALNPWFVFSEHAFSDLGGNMSGTPMVFNYGMMLTGLLIIIYGVFLVSISENKRQTIGSSFTMISGVFLLLIGYFPTGTYPHYFVSVYFFAQTDIAIGVWGLDIINGEYRDTGRMLLGLSVLGPVIAGMINWPSTAMVEAFGILIMNVWTVLMTRIKK